jgi:hypothetical protein
MFNVDLVFLPHGTRRGSSQVVTDRMPNHNDRQGLLLKWHTTENKYEATIVIRCIRYGTCTKLISLLICRGHGNLRLDTLIKLLPNHPRHALLPQPPL